MLPLIVSYLIAAIAVVSIVAFIEMKTGYETFLGYGLDYLMGLPIVFLITLITFSEFAILISMGAEPLGELLSLDVEQQMLIGFLVGGIHFTIMGLVAYIGLSLTFINKAYNPRAAEVSDLIIKILWVTGGLPLFFIAAKLG